MVRFNNIVNTTYNFNKYTIIKIPYKKTSIPVILDQNIYDKIKIKDYNWNVMPNGTLYTNIKNNTLYLHEIIYFIKNNKKNKRALIHINKIGIDNRYENIIEDTTDKDIKKNLNKKTRTIRLKEIDTSKIPSFVWYLKSDDSHGERFQINFGDIKWKSTSSDKLSLNYKLEETKKYLRQYKEKNPIQFKIYSMNSDLNEMGIKLKNDFYNILKTINMNFIYTNVSKTDILLKENTSKLNNIEKKLLEYFSIDSNETTYERLKKMY